MNKNNNYRPKLRDRGNSNSKNKINNKLEII